LLLYYNLIQLCAQFIQHILGTEEERIAVEEAKSYRANDDFEDDNKKVAFFQHSLFSFDFLTPGTFFLEMMLFM
jgi:hypothetical protein